VLIYMRCDVGEVTICVEFHQKSKPMKSVGCNAWCRLNGIPQLSIVCMEDNIGLPFFVHFVGVPQRTKLHATRGSKGSIFGNVAPSSSSHAMKAMSMRNQVKWNSYPWSCAFLQSSSS
jgi:hypothetical protein